jgi:hypothetical protein
MSMNLAVLGLTAVMVMGALSTLSSSSMSSGHAVTSRPLSRIRSGRPGSRLSFQFNTARREKRVTDFDVAHWLSIGPPAASSGQVKEHQSLAERR